MNKLGIGTILLAASIICVTTTEVTAQIFNPDRSELCHNTALFAGAAHNILFVRNEKYESAYATASEIGRQFGLTPNQPRDIVNVAFSMGSSGASQETILTTVKDICMIDGDPDSGK